MEDYIRRRVLSDLVIAFGFSRHNARVALERYNKGELTAEELDVIYHIIRKDPFGAAMGQRGAPQLRNNTIKILEHLNYRITTENDG